MQQHAVAPSNENNPPNSTQISLIQIACTQMYKRLMIMGPVTRTLLQRGIQPQTFILLFQILLENNLLVQAPFVRHFFEVIVIFVIGIVARAPFELELAKVVAKMLHVRVDATASVWVAEKTALGITVTIAIFAVVFAVVVTAVVVVGVDVDFVGGFGTIVVVGADLVCQKVP